MLKGNWSGDGDGSPAKYTTPIEEDEDVYTIKDFISACKSGAFIDYDGMGSPAKDGKKDARPEMWIQPSGIDSIPKDATHIVWYNR